MKHRAFVPWPHAALKTPATPVDAVTDDIRAIWDEMIQAMEAMPGVGLAAPQLGIGLRLAVVDASDTRGQVIRMANPEIINASVKFEKGYEASPNLPGVGADVRRPRGVSLRYMDETGMIVRKDLVGLWARSAQHQVDHLNGKMYFHTLSKLKRDMLLKKAQKQCG